MFGFDTSNWKVPDDFNDPLPLATLKAFDRIESRTKVKLKRRAATLIHEGRARISK